MIADARAVARFILYVLPLALALLFSSRISGSFSTPKTALFILTTTALIGCALLASSPLKIPASQRPFIMASALFVVVTVVAGVASPLRHLGLQSLVFTTCGFLLFVGARWALSGPRSEQASIRLLAAISASATLVAIIAIAQFCHADPLSRFGIAAHSGRMRMYATLGNPNFVAALLAGALPATLGLIRLSVRLGRVLIAVSMLIGVAVVLTGSRAAILAILVAVMLFAAVERQKRSTLIAICVTALLVPALRAAPNPRPLSESIRGRLFIWQVALADGAAMSSLGSGPGTFAYLYPEKLGRFFGTPGRESLLRFAGPERHAQNDLVEVLHDTGWIGLASLLGLVGTWFWTVSRTRSNLAPPELEPDSRTLTLSRTKTHTVSSAAIAGVSALCTVALFDFALHRPETWTLLWIWMALPLSSPKDTQRPLSRFRIFRLSGAVSIALVGFVLATMPVMSAYHLAQGEVAERRGRVQEAISQYRAALRIDTSSPDANFDLTRALAKSGDYSGAITQARLAVRYVKEPELYILLSRIIHNAGHIDEALSELETAEKLFPYSAELRSEVASFAMKSAVSD